MEIGELAVLSFGDLAHNSLKSMLCGGNGSVMAWFGIAITFKDGNDSFCFMDVESEVECLRCV
jgi:hypothetical protein